MEKTNTLFIPFFNESNSRKIKVNTQIISIANSFTSNFEESLTNDSNINDFILVKSIKNEHIDSIPWFREIYYDRNLIACISSLNENIDIDGFQLNCFFNINGQTVRSPFSLSFNHPNSCTKNKLSIFFLRIDIL